MTSTAFIAVLTLCATLSAAAMRSPSQTQSQNQSAASEPVYPVYPGKPVIVENPVETAPGVIPPKLIQKINPIYPPYAKDQRIVVTVVLEAVIGTDGAAKSLSVVTPHVDPDLERAAVGAVKQWHYEPASLAGRPVEGTVRETVNFFNTEAILHPEIISSLPPSPEPPPMSGPAIVSQIQPIYPPEAKEQNIRGAVVLQILISKKGDVQSIRVLSGDPLLHQSAIDAVSLWKYKPPLLNGEPVEIVTTVTVNYAFQ